MSDGPTFRVKNWRKFQHYSDRNPPWIKLHFELLYSRDWVTLDDASRVLAVACMLIASRNEGTVPADPDYLKRVAYLNKPPNFKPLIACGFLEGASGCKQVLADARPETETETETELCPAADGVTEVFDHWKAEHSHPKAKLDEKRRRLIRNALKNYSADDLKRCISGYKNSPHHMGQNDRQTVYDDIEIFLRDAKHIDAGLKIAGATRWQ